MRDWGRRCEMRKVEFKPRDLGNDRGYRVATLDLGKTAARVPDFAEVKDAGGTPALPGAS